MSEGFQGARCSSCAGLFFFYCETPGTACPYCGRGLNRVNVQGSPDQFFSPFTTTKAEFLSAALNWLTSKKKTAKYLPNEVLAAIGAAEKVGVYVPCFMYTGSFTADWTASIAVSRSESVLVTRNGETRSETETRTDWEPQSGRTHGRFAFLAYASSKLDEGMRAFVEGGRPGTPAGPEPRVTADFAQEYVEDWNPKRVYAERVDARLTKEIERQIRAQIPGLVGSLGHSAQITHDPESLIHMPIWLLAYEYGGERHHLVMDGCDPKRIIGTRPQDAARRAQVRKPFVDMLSAAIATMIAFMATSPWPDLQPVSMGGAWATWVLGIGAVIHRGRIHKVNRQVREQAVAAVRAGASFDVEAAMTKRMGRRDHKRFWRAWTIAAIVIAAVVSVAAPFRPDVFMPSSATPPPVAAEPAG